MDKNKYLDLFDSAFEYLGISVILCTFYVSPYSEALLVMGSTGTLELVCDDSTHYIVRVLVEQVSILSMVSSQLWLLEHEA